MFDTRKSLSIALSRIEKAFWCLLQTWCDDDDEVSEDWNYCLSEIDENSRAFKSKRSVSLEKSEVYSRKNWFEMIDENDSKEEL